MNKERIFDTVNEYGESYGNYAKESAKFYKKYGYHAYLDHTDEESRNLARLERSQMGDYYTVLRVCEIFEFGKEQNERLYIASRFLRRWYERENWEFCAPQDLIDRLWQFVIG